MGILSITLIFPFTLNWLNTTLDFSYIFFFSKFEWVMYGLSSSII